MNLEHLVKQGYEEVAILVDNADFTIEGDCVRELDEHEGLTYLWCRGEFVIKGVVKK